MSDHVSPPFKIAGKILVLYILIFAYLDSRREGKKASELNGSRLYPNLICYMNQILVCYYRSQIFELVTFSFFTFITSIQILTFYRHKVCKPHKDIELENYERWRQKSFRNTTKLMVSQRNVYRLFEVNRHIVCLRPSVLPLFSVQYSSGNVCDM
jgi:hypothetical protein